MLHTDLNTQIDSGLGDGHLGGYKVGKFLENEAGEPVPGFQEFAATNNWKENEKNALATGVRRIRLEISRQRFAVFLFIYFIPNRITKFFCH